MVAVMTWSKKDSEDDHTWLARTSHLRSSSRQIRLQSGTGSSPEDASHLNRSVASSF